MSGIGILGVTGRMGRAIANVAAAQDVAIAGGIDRNGEVHGDHPDAPALAKAADVLIDFTSPDALAEHSQLVHWPTEQAIAASGLSYTILRHALYAEMLVGDLDETLTTGVLRRCSGTAACSYVARDDLGLSAAILLAAEDRENRVLNETMERSYTGDEAADAIARCFGKPVRYEAVSSEDWPAYMTEKWGVPPAQAASTRGTMRGIEAGQFDIVSDDYRAVTGRSPQTLDEFLAGVRAARS